LDIHPQILLDNTETVKWNRILIVSIILYDTQSSFLFRSRSGQKLIRQLQHHPMWKQFSSRAFAAQVFYAIWTLLLLFKMGEPVIFELFIYIYVCVPITNNNSA